MHEVSMNQKKTRLKSLGCCFACLWLVFNIGPVFAEGGKSKNPSASTSQQSGGLSTDSLQKQITDLDGQIQSLREQSLALQERTRAKLQAQLEYLKNERDNLIPRIEKLRENSELAWQDIKENIQKVIEDLNTSVDTIEK